MERRIAWLAGLLMVLLVLAEAPAMAAFLAADMRVTRKGAATVGEDVFDGGGLTNPQVSSSKIKRIRTYMVCVESQPGSGYPSPADFFVQAKGDQKGYKAIWRDPGGVVIPDSEMVAGTDGPYSLLSGEQACLALKIIRTATAKRRATWVTIGAMSGQALSDGDHLSIVVRRR